MGQTFAEATHPSALRPAVGFDQGLGNDEAGQNCDIRATCAG
jgi:hypothetical protein